MADPCAQLVVTRRFEVKNAAPELLHPCAPLGRLCSCLGRHTGSISAFGEKPYRAAEKLAVRICRAANFLACHRVAGQESGLVRLIVTSRSTFAENMLYAADISYELMWLQN